MVTTQKAKRSTQRAEQNLADTRARLKRKEERKQLFISKGRDPKNIQAEIDIIKSKLPEFQQRIEARKEVEKTAITRPEREPTRITPEKKSVVQPTIDLTKQRAPIDISAPKKTGISALREEDNVVGAAIRVATDWKTTVALVGTLATLGGLAAAAPAAAASRGGVIASSVSAHARSFKTGGLIPLGTAAAQRQIVGKAPVAKTGVGKLFKAGANFATNTKSRALTTSMITKAGMSVGAAALVATAVGTYPFANFELAEATDKIGIAIFKAADAGDLEEVERLTEYLNEMTNPSVWDSIVNKIPFANVLNNVKKNIAAAQVSAESIRNSTQKKVEAAQAKAEEPTFEEQRIASEESARERELERREEDVEFFENIRKENEEIRKKEREEETKFWDDLAKKRQEEKDRERAEDDAYWRKIYAENAKRKAEERAADEAYWKEIKEKTTATTEPWTPADSKVVSDWNAGKSALNFKWLGL